MRRLLVVGIVVALAAGMLASLTSAGVRPVPIRGVGRLNDLDIVVVIHVNRRLPRRQRKELSQLLLDWYDVGVAGGYGGPDGDKGVFHFMSAVGYQQNATSARLAAFLDFGSAGFGAFLVLRRMLAVFNADQADFARPIAVKYVAVHDGPTDADCKAFPVIC